MKKALLILLVVALFLIAIERIGFFKKLEEGVTVLTNPIQVSFYAASHSISNKFSVLFEIGTLRKNNLDLEAENAALVAENGQLRKLTEQNQLLRDQLGLVKEEKVKLKSASVLGFTPSLTRGSITIAKGRDDGVKKGDIIIVKNILIGEVDRVKEKSSLVRLLNDPDSKVLGETENKARGIVVGDFGSRIKLTKVLIEDKITAGELVFSSGEENFPKGLVIGKISKVKRLEAELFQEAEIEPLLDINKLEMVFIRPI